MDSYNKILVDGLEISLDDASSEICFVSHAHSDHIAAFKQNKKIIASEETFALLEKKVPQLEIPKKLSLYPAGHMLGARQLLADLDGERFVYTGDFSLHGSYTYPPASILECDTLMIDSTYALPNMNFPKRQYVLEKMRKFVFENEDSIILFGAYTKGKSQELISFLNIECKIAPLVPQNTAKICEKYKKFGINLDYIVIGSNEAEEQMNSSFVAILPPNQVNFEFASKLSWAHSREVKTAIATGWAQVSRFPVDVAFTFSDHADFKDTLNYIYESGAKKIICANANQEAAATYLKKLGMNAFAKIKKKIEIPKQSVLSEF
jgi:Cft2 family RNA processing exonuclease